MEQFSIFYGAFSFARSRQTLFPALSSFSSSIRQSGNEVDRISASPCEALPSLFMLAPLSSSAPSVSYLPEGLFASKGIELCTLLPAGAKMRTLTSGFAWRYEIDGISNDVDLDENDKFPHVHQCRANLTHELQCSWRRMWNGVFGRVGGGTWCCCCEELTEYACRKCVPVIWSVLFFMKFMTILSYVPLLYNWLWTLLKDMAVWFTHFLIINYLVYG